MANDSTRDLRYSATRNGLLVVGKQSAEIIGGSAGRLVQQFISPAIADSLGSMAGALQGVGALVTVGLAAAISTGLTQMDYTHRTNNLKTLYKEELSARLQKPIDTLVRSDLDELAKSNKVVHEELERSRKQRNYGVALSCIASMASLAAIMLVLPELVGEALLESAGGMILKAAVGLVTYHVVKDPLHHIADKLYALDERTPNDYIVDIKRDRDKGKIISREQVLSVFVAANPELDKYIVAEYGKHFDDLSVADKQKATKEINNFIPLDRMTLDINSGKVNAPELAFAAQGQISGVNHETFTPEKAKSDLLGSMWSALGFHHEQHHDVSVAAEESFVTRLGLAENNVKMSHVEQLERSRSNVAMNPTSPSPF